MVWNNNPENENNITYDKNLRDSNHLKIIGEYQQNKSENKILFKWQG